MKLLYFTIQINMLGGLAKIVIDKINWLVDHGYDITLCNIERLDIKPAYPIDRRVKLVRGDISTEPGGIMTRIKGVFCAIRKTIEIIEQENPDIIINAHCPLVTWIIPWVPYYRSQFSRVCTVVEMHQSRQGLEIFNRKFMNGFSRWVHRWSIKWIYSKYDKFVVLTNGDLKAWSTNNCMVIPNFSTIKRKMVKLDDDSIGDVQKQIIMLARLMPQKRIDLMIEVWSKLAKDFPDWHVNVLGEGMLKDELKRKTKELGIEKSFVFSGGVKDVTYELEKSEILCLTSEYEGFGIVLIEAMQVGVPVIAFEYVGIEDIIEDGKDGIVVPFGKVNEYAEKLRMLMNSKNFREGISNNALKSVCKFDKEKVMNDWNLLFQSLYKNTHFKKRDLCN